MTATTSKSKSEYFPLTTAILCNRRRLVSRIDSSALVLARIITSFTMGNTTLKIKRMAPMKTLPEWNNSTIPPTSE